MAETTKTPKAPAKPRKTAAKKAAPETKTVTMAENGATIGNTNKIDPAQAKPMNVSREEVAKLAHKYWIESGRQDGKHEEHWYRAEQELRHHRHAS
jgi:DNA relaxase NicK